MPGFALFLAAWLGGCATTEQMVETDDPRLQKAEREQIHGEVGVGYGAGVGN